MITERKKNNSSGQILLIIIMILATVLTIASTLSFRSTTETQISEVETESQKALAAAEAGIETAIGTSLAPGLHTFTSLNLTNLDSNDINLDTSTVTVEDIVGNTFVSPPITTDQEFTFYLSDYSTGALSNPYAGTITVGYGNEVPCDEIVLELTILSGDPVTARKYIADSSGTKLNSSLDNIGNAITNTIDGTQFNCRTDAIALPADAKLLVIRTLFSKTVLGFSGSVTPLKSQGKFITSEAKSTVGIVKKVQLFQSYPQIPSEFFVTTF